MMANTKLLEREIHNLAAGEGTADDDPVRIRYETEHPEEALDAVAEVAGRGGRQR